MLGWHISVYRLDEASRALSRGSTPDAVFEQAMRKAAGSAETSIAVWQTGVHGLDWISELVEQGNAIVLSTNGYPNRYVASAGHLLASVRGGPPLARAVWSSGPQDIIDPKWAGETRIDHDAAAECDPDEWLLVEAWDES